MNRVPLSSPSFGTEEVYEVMESLLSTRVTIGNKVKRLEERYSKYIGCKYGTMTSSGSGANLVALSALSNPSIKNPMKMNEEIITPALTFATTVFPIHNIGMIPVFIDINLNDLTIDVDKIEKYITNKTKAIMPVHILGLTCDMKRIKEIADKHGLYIIEDCCDGSGAEIEGKKIGSFGDIGTYSFAFTHIMSTVEGGMLTMNDELYDTLSKSLRCYGWARNYKNKEEISKKYNIDSRFLFINVGYNFKPTDIQASFGLHQLNKLESFLKLRRKNAESWTKTLDDYCDYFYVIREKPNTKYAWYGYPVVVKPNKLFNRDNMTAYLNKCGIDTRPILAGNMVKQPVMTYIKHRKSNLTNSDIVHNNSFFIGNHSGITEDQRYYVNNVIHKFMRAYEIKR